MITKYELFRSQWNSTSPSIGIHGNQMIGQEMRNDNKNDYNAIRRDSKNSCYGTTGKVISNAYQSDKYLPILGNSDRGSIVVYYQIKPFAFPIGACKLSQWEIYMGPTPK